MRRESDPIYDLVFTQGRFRPEMRFLEKAAALAEVEKMIPDIKAKLVDTDAIRARGIHPLLNCPDLAAADAMYEKIIAIKDSGDSSGGLVEVIATGVPAGLGEPVFRKLDGELGRMLSIGAVKAVEVGAGYAVKDMTGSQTNDEMRVKDGKVAFKSNNAGGITGGLTTGQPIVARLAVKPTPTIAKPQDTIDKVALTNARLEAVTRRDPTIVSRVWPVAEAFTAIVLVDMLMMDLAVRGAGK
jgi:chorismate synthase